MYRNISQYSEKISQYIAIRFSCVVTPLSRSLFLYLFTYFLRMWWYHVPGSTSALWVRWNRMTSTLIELYVFRLNEVRWYWFLNIICNDISVKYMWRHIYGQAEWRRSWTYGRASNAMDKKERNLRKYEHPTRVLHISLNIFNILCGFWGFVVLQISGHFWGVYQSHYCASDGVFLFFFVYVMYLNIASDQYGKQIKPNWGISCICKWFSFVCTWIG